jgi:hypothetical protein
MLGPRNRSVSAFVTDGNGTPCLDRRTATIDADLGFNGSGRGESNGSSDTKNRSPAKGDRLSTYNVPRMLSHVNTK